VMTAATLRYIMRDPSTQTHKRGVAQPGSAPPCGGGGRRFKSSRPDHSSSPYMPSLARLVFSILPPIEAVIPEERSVGFFNIPVAAAEHRSRNRECRETFDRARGALYSARRVRRAPVPARSAGRFRWLRGAFSFWVFWAPPPPGRGPWGRGAPPQFCSRQNCLCANKDKFDGIEFGQPKVACRARTKDGPSPKSPAVGQPPTRMPRP